MLWEGPTHFLSSEVSRASSFLGGGGGRDLKVLSPPQGLNRPRVTPGILLKTEGRSWPPRDFCQRWDGQQGGGEQKEKCTIKHG